MCFVLSLMEEKSWWARTLIKLDSYFDGSRHGAENAWTYYSWKSKFGAEFVELTKDLCDVNRNSVNENTTRKTRLTPAELLIVFSGFKNGDNLIFLPIWAKLLLVFFIVYYTFLI